MKRFILKSILFLGIILVLQTIITRYYPYPPPKSVTSLIEFKNKGVDVIFFGDSTLTWFSKYDTDKRTTPEMLSEILSTAYTVGAIPHNAYHANIYDLYTKYMQEIGYSPWYIVIPINLRSFSPEWDVNPGAQFIDEQLYFTYYKTPFVPFLSFITNLTLPDTDRIYHKIYSFSPYYDGDTKVGRVRDYLDSVKESKPQDDRRKAMFQMFYLGAIHQSHTKMQGLTNIADRYAKDTNTKVIFYITPIDYESGEQFFGKRFTQQVKKNTGIITAEMNTHGIDIIDLSLSLPTNNFLWHETTSLDEHLTQVGRRFVAESIARQINQNSNKKR